MTPEAKPATPRRGRQAALEAHRRGEIPLNEPAKYYAMGYDAATAKLRGRDAEQIISDTAQKLLHSNSDYRWEHITGIIREAIDAAIADFRQTTNERKE